MAFFAGLISRLTVSVGHQATQRTVALLASYAAVVAARNRKSVVELEKCRGKRDRLVAFFTVDGDPRTFVVQVHHRRTLIIVLMAFDTGYRGLAKAAILSIQVAFLQGNAP
ncbi:MAG: hypothetical protein GY822_00420 [Deltaproteobacteria bacterium]|nr:hypothetical protein [Deltaproteobacteria bacterium]